MSFQANVNAENSPVTGEVVENGTQIIESGGWTQDAVVGTGGNQTIYAGGKVVNTTVNAGGVVMGMGGGAVVEGGSISGANATIQISGEGSEITGTTIAGSEFAKVEVWTGAKASDILVSAGAPIATGTGKKGAYLIVTGAGAEASGITITDFGSASVYDGAKIMDSVVEAGGILAMSYRKLNDGTSAGYAENITVKEDGIFWVGKLGSVANNITFEAGSFIGGFGLDSQGTSFTNSKVIGYDGSETTLTNWNGGDYTVANGLILLMSSRISDDGADYVLDLSKVILDKGGAIQKSVTDNTFSSADTVEGLRVIDPETGDVLDASISGGKATNWVVNKGQEYTFGANDTGLIVYEGGILNGNYSTSANQITGRYVYDDGSVVAFSCADGVAENLILDGKTLSIAAGGKSINAVLTNGGVINGMGGGATVEGGSVSGENSTIQITGADSVISGTVLSGTEFAKIEVWDGAKAYDILVSAGAPIATGMGKEGAFLIITGAGAEASGITVTDFGSAAVYNGAKISDSVVEAGGVLTMSYRKLNDGASAGSAENITVKEDGLFWVGTLGSTANNVTFEAGSFIGGFGLGTQGTTFTNSKVIGYDGSETELANWDGGDYTVANGLILLMSSRIADDTADYVLDLSKVILDKGGAIQKSVTDNSFTYEDTIEGLRVVDPETGAILDASIVGGKATNWVVNNGQSYRVDGGWGAKGSADGLIVYEGGSITGMFVGRPGPIAGTPGTVITNGRYVKNDGTIVNFSCGNGYAENMIVEDGTFTLNGYTGAYTESTLGSGAIVKNTTMINGLYVQGNLAYSDGLTVSGNTAIQVYSYAEITNGVNLDESEDSIYRNFSLKDGVASGFILENGGFLVLAGELVSTDGTLPTIPAGSATNIIVRGTLAEKYWTGGAAGQQGNNNRADRKSYLQLQSGAVIDNVSIQDGGILTSVGSNWTANNVTIDIGGATDITIGNDTILNATVMTEDGSYTLSWDAGSGVLAGYTLGGDGNIKITLADGIEVYDFNDMTIIDSTYSLGIRKTYNNLTIDNSTVTSYDTNTVNGMTVGGSGTFLQFTKGTFNDVALNGGKFEAAGTAEINNIVIDGTLYNTPVGDTSDNIDGHVSTQLVAYADGVVINGMVLQNGGSAFIYAGATASGATVNSGGVLYLTNWNKDTNTTANILGDLVVQTGGTLWLGSTENNIEKIQTYAGANIVGIASGTVINDIVLRGANIEIDDKLTINNALMGNNQTQTGGLVKTLTNNFGVWTMEGGVLENYIHNNGNNVGCGIYIKGGTVQNLDLTKYNGTSYILGGAIEGGTMAGGTLSDVDATDPEAVVTGNGSISNFTVTGAGILSIASENTVLSNITLKGGTIDAKVDISGINIYGGKILGSNAVNDSTIYEATDMWSARTYNNLTIDGAAQNIGGGNIFNNLTVNDATLMSYSAGNTINGMTITGGKTFAQAISDNVFSDVEMYGGKFEVAGTTVINGVMIDGTEFNTAPGDTSDNIDGHVSTQLVAYAAGAVVNDMVLRNGGSAFIYNGATANNVTVEKGGVLYMTNWNQDDGVNGVANGVTVQDGGYLYYRSGSTVNDLTINKGATLDARISWTDSFAGTYVDGDTVIDYTLNGEEANTFVVTQGTTFLGNYTAAGGSEGGVATFDKLYVVEGGSMLGWHFGNTVITEGAYIANDGTRIEMNWGSLNETGGKHIQGGYFYNGSAVLGGGSAKLDEATGEVTFTINTLDNVIFDNSLFVAGNVTKSTNLVFRNGTSLQTYSNAEMSGINEDEAEDSVYRNFSLKDGVASGFIIDNGGFLQMMPEGYNWKGNTPSPAASAFDIYVRGSRTEVAGNYNADMMNMFNGGSYIQLSSGTYIKNLRVGTGAGVRVMAGNDEVAAGVIEDMVQEAGAITIFEQINRDSKINATVELGEGETIAYTIADGVVSNYYQDNAKSRLTGAANLTFENLTVKAGTVSAMENTVITGTTAVSGSGTVFSATTVKEISGNLSITDGASVTFGSANEAAGANLESLVVDNASFSTTDINYGCDVTISNGSKVTWTGGSIADGKTMTVDGAGTEVTMSWHHSNWGSSNNTLKISNGGYVVSNGSNGFGKVIIENGNLYHNGTSYFKDITLQNGWIQMNATYAGNVTIGGGTDEATYYQVIGTATGTTTLNGIGSVYVGSAAWGAAAFEGKIVVSTKDKEVGNVCLRNGSINGLEMNGGTFWYRGSYRVNDEQVTSTTVSIAGDIMFSNAKIVSGNMEQTNTETMDLTGVSSLVIGNNTDVNISINASDVNVSVGGGINIAEGKTITVGAITGYDFRNAQSYEVYGALTGDMSQWTFTNTDKPISISSITVGGEGVYHLGNVDYLKIRPGVAFTCGGYTATIDELGVDIVTEASYGTTMTIRVDVDENNNAVLTVYRSSSADKVDATWYEGWSYDFGEPPVKNIPVRASDVEAFASVAGVLDIQSANEFSAQGRFVYSEPNATGGVSALAYMDNACDGLTVVMTSGSRQNSWAEVNGTQNLTLIAGGIDSEGNTVTTAAALNNNSYMYIYGGATTEKVFGGGANNFEVKGSTNVAIEGGSHKMVVGGGHGSTVGAVNLDIVGGAEVTSLVAGAMGNVTGDVNITLDAVSGVANIYGGAINSAVPAIGNVAVDGDYAVNNVVMSITNSNLQGLIFGGGVAEADGKTSTAASTTVTFSGSTHTGNPDLAEGGRYNSAWIVGGGLAKNTGIANVTGTAVINVTADANATYILGGGVSYFSGATASVGSTFITVDDGATVSANIYGGGYSLAGGASTVNGDAVITIDATAADKIVSVQGNIYAGGWGNNSTVTGDAYVVFKGSSDSLAFTGEVNGNGNVEAVVGNSYLVFEDFSGVFSASVVNFDYVKLSSDTAMSFDQAASVNGFVFDVADRDAALVDEAVADATNLSFNGAGELVINNADLFTDGTSMALLSGADELLTADTVINLFDQNNELIGTFNYGETFASAELGFTLESKDGKVYLNVTAL